MSESDLVKRARELLVGVTEGPWLIDDREHTRVVARTGAVALTAETMGNDEPMKRWVNDAAFIAASRALVPELLEALEAAEADRASLRKALVALDGEWSECERMATSDASANAFWECRRGLLAALKGPDNADG